MSQESSQSQHILAGVFVAGHAAMNVAVVREEIVLWYTSRRGGGGVIEEPTLSQRGLRRPVELCGTEEASLEDSQTHVCLSRRVGHCPE